MLGEFEQLLVHAYDFFTTTTTKNCSHPKLKGTISNNNNYINMKKKCSTLGRSWKMIKPFVCKIKGFFFQNLYRNFSLHKTFQHKG